MSLINSSHAILAEYLKDQPDQQPSFARDGPQEFPANAPQHVNTARQNLVSAARDLQLLALYPTEAVHYLGLEALGKMSLQFITHFNIPSHIPLDSSISYTTLSQKLSIPESRLTRILRHAILTHHIFHEPSPGQIAHTSISAALLSSKSVADVLYDWMYPGMPAIVKATEKFGAKAEESGNEAMGLVLGGGENGEWGWASLPQDFTGVFAEYMKASVEGTTIKQVVSGWNWRGLGEGGVVVDVGGNVGHIGTAIAEAAPELRVVVQDLAEAVRLGEKQLPDHLKGRVSFMEHDFFKPNPIQGASVYFFSRIIHDWNDEKSVVILKNVATAMDPKLSKIILCEKIMPAEPGKIPQYQETFMRNLDLAMMMMNGAERTMEQWKQLVDTADVGLRISDVVQPEGSLASLIVLEKVAS
ncbi:Hps1-dma1 cluster O-methyltransferase [Pseudocercospora fuligena]|uniref:Hps1-dma1 cluster O-methyltransferase n=1 Tax=Pseudocercospora fuligena TaxID=685502 RepID=A0A8H6RQD3_9PEZI|nr:Hps1-dma1 cluster O-methyltransferase [Pseudocercospora fuligena]